jgi:hypothetical protein
MEYDQKPTYVYRWSLTVDRQIGPWLGSIAYTGSRGVHLLVQADANQNQWIGFPNGPGAGKDLQWPGPELASTRVPINPAFQNIWVTSPRASSFYHGMSASVQRRMAAGLQVQAAYNFSKNIDYGSGSSNSEEGLPQNQRIDTYWQHWRMKGISQLSVKHNFVSNFTYDLPGTALTGIAGKIINGWQINGIVTLSSGTPFTVYDSNREQTNAMRKAGRIRPNVISGGKQNLIVGDPDRWFDVNQFIPSTCRAGVYCYTDAQGNPYETGVSRGNPVPQASLGYVPGFWGVVGPNTLIGPGLALIDFSINKNIPVRESQRFQFRTEIFNLFNHPNFRIPETTLFSNNGSRNVQAGRINSTRTSARQIQFGLKFIF